MDPLPEPIDPKTLTYSFSRVPGLPRKDSDSWTAIGETVENAEGRFLASARGAGWLRLMRGTTERFPWKEWYWIPVRVLKHVFSFEELFRLWFSSVIDSDLARWIGEAHPFLRKICFAHWHYGFTRHWNLFVDHLEGFKRLRADLPDFDVRITHTRTINQAAWAWHVERLYLDASFGLLLYYKGKHVLTVGFAPSKHGILVAQVQLREKKGNRFLYHLPTHYLDVALEILRKAFRRSAIWLVTGESTVDAIRKAYKGKPCDVDNPDVAARIAGLYNKPLDNYTRTNKTVTYEDRTFVRLAKKVA